MKKIISFLFALKFLALLGIIGGTMLWVGITRLKNSQEKSITAYNTIDELRKEGPKWISIRSCSLQLMSSAYIDELSSEKIKEIFIPIEKVKDNSADHYFLHTKDPALVSIFEKHITLEQKIRTSNTAIKMAEKNPGYLKLLKSSLPELKQQAQKMEAERIAYMQDNLSTVQPIKGMLDLEFEISDSNKMKLGAGNIHIIKHNAEPEKGFYTWFLLIAGAIVSVVFILSGIGFLLKGQAKQSEDGNVSGQRKFPS